MTKNKKITEQGFLPNFCDVSIIFMLILLAELFALLMTLAAPMEQIQFWSRFALISMYVQWVSLLNAALLCYLRPFINQLSIVKSSASSFILMMLVNFVFSLLVVAYGDYVGVSVYSSSDGDQGQLFILRNLAMSAVVFSVVLRYFYIQCQWKRNLQAQAHAQIEALKARIRPHFLFNSMNTIASLISIDATKAEKAVEDLSDLFRASLQEKQRQTLADEVQLVTSYLDIEQLRLGDRLQIEWQLALENQTMEVPTLCLQPLVENAIYHGIEPQPEGGIIKIQAHIENNSLCLSVVNPINHNSQMIHHKGNHMAQDNIRKRLQLTYGEKASFEIHTEQKLYQVVLKIPVTV